VLTVSGALSYGELAAMMPQAGGMYVYLREAYSPLWGFLYGWTLFTVIQTGTIAAVAIAFARFSGLLAPSISESKYLIGPLRFSSHYAISLSTAQLVAILLIVLLTITNSRGLKYGKIVQNVFTITKTAALLILIGLGFTIGRNPGAISENFHNIWAVHGPIQPTLAVTSVLGLVVAICVSQTGALFSADSWHDITFVAAEVRNPRKTLPIALGVGTMLVIGLYLLANVAYLMSLSFQQIQQAPADRVASFMMESLFHGWGGLAMAAAIMASTLGTVNALTLAGARAYYAMACDGLFPRSAAKLNRADVPGVALLLQGIWSVLLVLPRTYDPQSGQYGNLYSNLLEYVISAALIFYVMTIAGVIRMRFTRPKMERSYRTLGYPLLPIIYILGATLVLVVLFIYRPATTWPGLAIIGCGVPVYFLLRRQAAAER
jgi:basic amino acid/polyamine antiporter, APA family